MRIVICTLVFVQLFCSAFSKDLPANFKKCKRSDAGINQCLKVAVQEALGLLENGLPSFEIPVMEPLRIQSMVIGAGPKLVQVVHKYKDVDIYNLTKVTITDTKAKLTDTELVLEFDVEQELITLKGHYEFAGKALLLPIYVKGLFFIEFLNVKMRLTVNGAPVERYGKTYMKIKEVKVILNPEKYSFNFENLFNGDTPLNKALNEIVDLLVFSDIHSEYEEFLSVVIKDMANKIFELVPYEDLFPQ